MVSRLLGSLLLLGFLALALGDVYMHNPRGSNDRNCERNVNRDNDNRLFDSQNNAKGGYACPRSVGGLTPNHQEDTHKMYHYIGSKLQVEWTNQHGCGSNPKVLCDLVIQYMCGPEVRDGVPEGVNDAATTTIPDDKVQFKNPKYGMHEHYDYYQKCKTRERNMGIFTADQKVNRHDARGTRQNPNGARHGFECPEERDYYPYWHWTPWKDIAILTDDSRRCDYYKRESQNVKTRWECTGDLEAASQGEGWNKVKRQWKKFGIYPNNEAECKAWNMTWEETPAWNIAAPECNPFTFYSRSNHLGNSIYWNQNTLLPQPISDHYNWTIPNDPQDNCVLRIRYNISTTDFQGRPEHEGKIGAKFTNATWNEEFEKGKGGEKAEQILNGQHTSPVLQDPYIQISQSQYLALALNTDQYGRTFQDRSYIFSIKKRPANIPEQAKIWNLNVRGKRGNIVQTFPAVEYDFVPNVLLIDQNDYVHIQWTGSDYNPRRGCNDAEGGPPDLADGDPQNNPRADRSNIVEVDILADGVPDNGTEIFQNSIFPDQQTILKLAYLDQKDCMSKEELYEIKNNDQRNYHRRNCFKINSVPHPYFDAGLVQMTKKGIGKYMSSRNNNFSNRDQKGMIVVGQDQPLSNLYVRADGTKAPAGSTGTQGAPRPPERASSLLAGGFSSPEAPNALLDTPGGAAESDNAATASGIKTPCGTMIYPGYSSAVVAGIAFGTAAIGAVIGLVIVVVLVKKGVISFA